MDMKTGNKNVAICLYSTRNKITLPHPITEFINTTYYVDTKSLNSLLYPARIICRFLNFIMYKIDSKDPDFMQLSITGLCGLQTIHGSRFITYTTSKGLSRGTVYTYDYVLNKFYSFLSNHEYIDQTVEFKERSIFKDMKLQTEYPPRIQRKSRHKLKDFGANRYELIESFISTSIHVAPDITLALCLQFFGGLRRGEIVNITYNDIDVQLNHSMVVKIKDNRLFLFSHLKDTSSEFPKRVNYLSPHLCKQNILNTPILWDAYNHHTKLYPGKSEKDPLLLNSDNKAMSGKVYDRRFLKVKKAFLQKLKEQRKFEDYNLLTDSTWKSHIGRGNFTNILFDMGLTATQIAIARGDSNINSALDYVDEKATYNAIQENLELLKNLSL